jgi:hypothetical protein
MALSQYTTYTGCMLNGFYPRIFLGNFADILRSVRIIKKTLFIITGTNDLTVDGYHKSSSGKRMPAVSHAFDSNLSTSCVARSYARIPCRVLLFHTVILSCVALIFHFVVVEEHGS